jgi:glycosyltransferase involved in cell wall biosynthesis
MEYKLSLCVCIKNEAKYMDEFIQHYIKQGVDHFYIINNNSTDNIAEVIEQSPHKNSVTLITDNRDMQILKSNSGSYGHKQLLDQHLYDRIKKETEWAIIVDADEFMFGKNGHTIKSYLSTIDPSVGCVYVIWNIINPVRVNDKLAEHFSISTNIKRLNYDLTPNISDNIMNANDFGKSIVRTSMLIDSIKLWLHKIPVNGTTITNYGPKNNNFDNGNFIKYSEDAFKKLNITLNHYAIRNLDDYEKKKKQIDVVPEKNRFIHGLFEMMELDDSKLVEDDYITRL